MSPKGKCHSVILLGFLLPRQIRQMCKKGPPHNGLSLMSQTATFLALALPLALRCRGCTNFIFLEFSPLLLDDSKKNIPRLYESYRSR